MTPLAQMRKIEEGSDEGSDRDEGEKSGSGHTESEMLGNLSWRSPPRR